MIYDVRQTTIYHYASPVAVANHVLRLTPIDRPHQRVHAAALEVSPHPVERQERRDFFGNHMTSVVLNEPHDTLNVKVAARIAVEHGPAADPSSTPPWEEVRAAAYLSSDLSPDSPSHYLFPSRLVSLDPEIRDYASTSFTPGRPVLNGAIDLMHRIKAEFAYEIGATTATTTPSMSFQSDAIVVSWPGCVALHGALIRAGTNCFCCSSERLQGSSITAGRDDRP